MSSAKKRVLLVTYYFPPGGGAGVQRTLKLTKYFRAFGWEPVVLTVKDGAYADYDETLLADIPAGVEIHRTKARDPFKWYAKFKGQSKTQSVKQGAIGQAENWKEKLAQWVRANIFLPDARVGWKPFAVKKGLELIKKGQIDAILTSGPPHSIHLIGQTLQRKTGVPWLADFRDPWTQINYYHELPHSNWALKKDARTEESILNDASHVVTVSPSWKTQLLGLSDGKNPAKFGVVHNGFDHDDVKEVDPISDENFVLGHIGSLYATRNPVGFWRIVAGLIKSGQVPKLKVKLIGKVSDEVKLSLLDLGIDKQIEFSPYVPHPEAVANMKGADLLLLVIEPFKGNEGMITGKLYEYLASGRPILALGPTGGDASKLIDELSAGQLFDHNYHAEIEAFILAQYQAWESGNRQNGTTAQEADLYSRRSQTGIMAGELDKMIARKTT